MEKNCYKPIIPFSMHGFSNIASYNFTSGEDSSYQHTSCWIYNISFVSNVRMFVKCFFSSKITIQYNIQNFSLLH